MTEAEWLACDDPASMLMFLRKRGVNRSHTGRRQLRLVGCACVRRVAEYLTKRGQRWVGLAEQIADNLLKLHDRGRVQAESLGSTNHQKPDQLADAGAWFTLAANVMIAADAAASSSVRAVEMSMWHKTKRNEALANAAAVREQKAQAVLIRDIFGNPFRPVKFSPEWWTSTAVALARGIYEERDFDRMPILADALQDAGCDNADILAHCRDEKQPHVRGCWVVDTVLGKE